MIYDDLKLCHIWIKWSFSIIELMLNNIVYIPSKLGPLWYFLVTLFVYRNIKPINLKHVFSKNEKKKKEGKKGNKTGGVEGHHYVFRIEPTNLIESVQTI